MGVGVDKCRGYSDGVKGDPRDPSPTWLRKYREDDEEEAVTKIEITSWKARAYGIFTRVGEVSEIERVSAANE